MADERKPMANIAPFGLRMQPDLKAWIEESARENNRSLNAEIVERLEQSQIIPALVNERDYFEAQYRKATKTISDAAKIGEQRMLLEAEWKRGEAQKAALQETKEYVDLEMQHLMLVREQNNAHLAKMEKLRAEMVEAQENRHTELEKNLAAATEKATKMESLLNQARSRLGIIREERDELARFVKLAGEGVEKDFMGWQKIADLSDREILMRILQETSRLSSEITVDRSRERDDVADLIADLNTDADHIEQAYLPGLSDDPNHGAQRVSHPKTMTGMLLSNAIQRRTELAMRTIVKDLEKNGMLALDKKTNTRPTAEEWYELRAAPKEVQGDILEALANVEVDRALEIARRQRKKGAA